MTPTPQSDPSRGQGRRAEEVASWYFRLNGFLQIPGFVLHSERPRRPITDADVLGVRFPYSHEFLSGIRMTDDRWLSESTCPGQTLVIIVEVKVAMCDVNGPWLNRDAGGMEKIIRRVGFAPDEMTGEIAKSLYDTLQWQNNNYRVQYVAIGQRPNHERTRRYPKLKQLTWGDIAAFLHERFSGFGAMKGAYQQWPTFGRKFSRAIQRQQLPHLHDAVDFVTLYIAEGASIKN